MQSRLQHIVNSGLFQSVVLVLIIANAVILGIETVEPLMSQYGTLLKLADRIIIYAFVLELIVRFASSPRDYFRSGWNIFDFLIVMISLSAATSGLAAIRAFRVLRVLRVVTVIPRMRVVVSALLDSIPGIASVGVVLVLIIYVFAVIASSLYGPQHPAMFGNVFIAMYTLFTVMTLEGWREIADGVGATHPNSWIFFLTFLLIATFTMLNLFVAIVVRVVEEDAEADASRDDALMQEVQALRADVAKLVAQSDRS